MDGEVYLICDRWMVRSISLREKSIVSVLVGLKDTSQVVAHCDIFSRSVISWPAAVQRVIDDNKKTSVVGS